MNRLVPRQRVSFRDVFRRVDRIAGDLNVLLVVIAIGLAALDATFFVSEQVVHHLPPITHIDHSASAQGE